ncbi:unnamed protein product, partial [marine sediment metagenome]
DPGYINLIDIADFSCGTDVDYFYSNQAYLQGHGNLQAGKGRQRW